MPAGDLQGEELLTNQLVILVGGLLTAGKDEFADHLVREHNFAKLGMSDTLAEALRRLNPIIGTVTDDNKDLVGPYRYQEKLAEVGYVGAKKNDEVRRLLQVLGTEVGRELFGQNFWVDMAENRIRELTDAGRDVVLTGARFPNEVELADTINQKEKAAATTVWVDRPGLEQAGHASETSVSSKDFQYTLFNNGTLQELYTASDSLLRAIRTDYL